MKTAASILLFLSICSLVLAGPSLSFTRITDNNAANEGVDEAQFSAEIISVSESLVKFSFYNSGPLDSSITQIYFDDTTPIFQSVYSIDNSYPGVNFSIGATPSNLPAGNTISFHADYSVGATAPVQPNGINPGEYLGITMMLAPNQTYEDALAALADGSLRIGLHVQGFADGSSESYVNNFVCPPVIPAPASILLAGLGTAIVNALRKRRTLA